MRHLPSYGIANSISSDPSAIRISALVMIAQISRKLGTVVYVKKLGPRRQGDKEISIRSNEETEKRDVPVRQELMLFAPA
jgi:hypothetical protein